MAKIVSKGRERFIELDNEANEAAVRILNAMAKLAEEKPEEFFGLKPTELQELALKTVFRPEIIQALNSVGSFNQRDDIVGAGEGDKGIFDSVKGIFGDLFKKIDIAGQIIDLLKSEKEFWTGGE